MAERHWVGGTASWDATAGTKWALTNGGAGGQAVPTAADDVYFDSGSGTPVVTLTTGIVCRSIDCNGYTGTISHPNSVTVNIGDGTAGAGSIALRLVAGMTYTLGASPSGCILNFISTSATVQALWFGGKTTGALTFNGVGGSWQFASAHTANGTSVQIILTNGTLDTNGQTCSWYQFSSTNSNTRVLTLGASAISVLVTWDCTIGTNMTLNANTSIITMTNSGTINFLGGGLTYNEVRFTGNGNTGSAMTGANSFSLLKILPTTTGHRLTLAADIIVTGTMTLTGVAAGRYRVRLASSLRGTQRTVTAAAVALTNVDFSDINGAGAASWSGTSVADAQNNSGITFTTPVTRYKIGGTGSWYDTAMWSTSSGGGSGASAPLVHDTVIFDANSFSADAQTLTLDSGYYPSMDFTNIDQNIVFTPTNVLVCCGNLVFRAGMTFGGTSSVTFYGLGTTSLNLAGATYDINNNILTVDVGTGTLQLTGDLIYGTTRTLILNTGTFDANDFNVTGGGFDSSQALTRGILMGNGTWTMNGTNPWSVSQITGWSQDAEGSTLVFTDTSATTKTIRHAGNSSVDIFNIIRIDGHNVLLGGLSQTMTVKHLILNNPGYTFKIPVSAIQEIRKITVNSSVGAVITITSATAATAGTMRVPAGYGDKIMDYVSIQDITVFTGAGGNEHWYAGIHSTNVSNNSGWIWGAKIVADLWKNNKMRPRVFAPGRAK